MFHITVEDLNDLTAFVYRKSGIRFEEKKRYFLNKRVEKRLVETQMSSIRDYIRFLKFKDDGSEFQELMNLLTVNETYFFREYNSLEAFAEHCLQEVADKKGRNGKKSLRILSAGCSTGEEAYTLAIIVREMLDDPAEWDIEITAVDIDQEVLKRARDGVYDDRSVKDVPQEYYEKYFENIDGFHAVTDDIKSMVSFHHMNLSDRAALRSLRGFDFIFCRNVLIYFDDQSRRQVVDYFYIALNHGGYIFLGHSESVGRITTAFSLKRFGKHLVYGKE